MTDYLGKPLSEHSLWDLGTVLTSLKDAEAKREEASKHEKFNQDVILPSGKKRLKMEFPPPNPAFTELKEAIELEIKNRNNNTEKF